MTENITFPQITYAGGNDANEIDRCNRELIIGHQCNLFSVRSIYVLFHILNIVANDLVQRQLFVITEFTVSAQQFVVCKNIFYLIYKIHLILALMAFEFAKGAKSIIT